MAYETTTTTTQTLESRLKVFNYDMSRCAYSSSGKDPSKYIAAARHGDFDSIE